MPLLKDKNILKFVKVAASNAWAKNGVEMPYPPTHPPETKQTAEPDKTTTGSTVKSTGEALQLANENIKCKSTSSVAKVELAPLHDPDKELVDMVSVCSLTCKTSPDVGFDAYTCLATNSSHCRFTRDLDFEVIEGEIEGDPNEWVAKVMVSVQGGDVPAGTTWQPKLSMTFMGSDEQDEVNVTMKWNKNAGKWDLDFDHTEDDGSVGIEVNVQVPPKTVHEFPVYLVATETDAVTMHGSINDEALNTGIASINLPPAEAERKLTSYLRGVVIYQGVVREDDD